MVDGTCVEDVVEGLGLPKQNQKSRLGNYSILLRQELTDDMSDHIIPLNDVPSWMSAIVADPSKATYEDILKIVSAPEWCGEAI